MSTNPTGLSFTVDGIDYTSTQIFTWNVGSAHTIATTSPQPGAPGTQSVFNNWSDGGAISHGVTAPATATTYTANFDTQYQLTTAANPSNGGTVSPPSGNFYNANTVVPLSASPNSGFAFSNWTGSVADPNSANTTITMTGPQSVTANFAVNTVQVTVGHQPWRAFLHCRQRHLHERPDLYPGISAQRIPSRRLRRRRDHQERSLSLTTGPTGGGFPQCDCTLGGHDIHGFL